MTKKVFYVIACVVVLITNNGSNAFRKGMFVDNISIETTIEE
jgi:hypothetical protein